MPIRLATPSDCIDLVEVERAASPYPWSLAQIIQNCRRQSSRILLLAQEDGTTSIGFAILNGVVDEITLLNIAVHPDYQGQGHGMALMQEVLPTAVEMGGRRLLLEVRNSNNAAIALYRKFGFSDDGVRREYYPAADGREDALLMSMQLVSEK